VQLNPDSAKESVATLPGIKNHCNKQVKKMAMQQWDEHLGTLQVQRKFSVIVAVA